MITRSLILLSVAAAALGPVSELRAQDRIEAITKPSDDRILSFIRPGRVAKVNVKEGDDVKAGQELLRLDDEAEMTQLEQLKAQAESDIHVRAADARLAQRRVDLKKIQDANATGVATATEVERAELEVIIADLSLQLAAFDRQQDQRKYREACLQLERMKLLSPIDGKVENLLVKPGVSADAQEKIVRVVKIDPFWVDVPVPRHLAMSLRKNSSSAEVEFETRGAEKPKVTRAAVIHIAAVGDAASDTLTVRVEVPNPEGRAVGERVYVSFPDLRTVEGPGPGGRKERVSG